MKEERFLKIDIVPFAEVICQKRLGVHHVLVHHQGQISAAFHFQPTDRRTEIHSATKSVVGLAAGMAVDEGLFTLDTHPTDILSKYIPDSLDPAWRHVTVRHLLTMSSGHNRKLMDGYSLIPGVVNRDDLENKDWVNYAFSQSLDLEPGRKFVYNNSCPHLISRMITELTGENLIDWLRPRLFDPLEIHNPQWGTDPLGYTCGPGGLQLSAEEFSRIIRLYLQQGQWKGNHLVSGEYMSQAVSRQIENAASEKARTDDSTAGYGYFIWRCFRDNAYYLFGWAGQLGIVLPDYEAAVTLTSYEFQTQSLMDAVWDTIVPQLR